MWNCPDTNKDLSARKSGIFEIFTCIDNFDVFWGHVMFLSDVIIIMRKICQKHSLSQIEQNSSTIRHFYCIGDIKNP